MVHACLEEVYRKIKHHRRILNDGVKQLREAAKTRSSFIRVVTTRPIFTDTVYPDNLTTNKADEEEREVLAELTLNWTCNNCLSKSF